MAHREFVDDEGTSWQVWEVIPTSAERRSVSERRFGARATSDRRVRREVRIQMEDGLGAGWLVFESPNGKRRLHPIPDGWADRPDSELVLLCHRAEPSSRGSQRSAD